MKPKANGNGTAAKASTAIAERIKLPTAKDAETTREIAARLGISPARVLGMLHALDAEGRLRTRQEKRRYINGVNHLETVFYVEG